LTDNKFENLKKILRSYESVAVAFSSGVDSTFLLKVAHDVLGEKVLAITATSNLFPKREIVESKNFCEREKIRQIIFDVNNLQEIEDNPPNRCYICKKKYFHADKKNCGGK